MQPLSRLGLCVMSATALLCSVSVHPVRAQDPVVTRGVAQYRDSANTRAASETLGSRLELDLELTREDQLRARTYLAISLLSLGDTMAAMPHVVEAIRIEPCLTLHPGVAAEEVRAVFRWAKQYTTCIPMQPNRAMVLSFALPGLGQLLGGRVRTGTAFMAGTGAAMAAGAALLYSGSKSYDEYLDATHPAAAARLYDEAEQRRKLGVGALLLGAAVWVSSAIEARHGAASRLEQIEQARQFALQPLLENRADGVGLGLAITF